MITLEKDGESTFVSLSSAMPNTPKKVGDGRVDLVVYRDEGAPQSVAYGL